MWLVRPAQVFNYIGMAAFKMQNIVYWYFYVEVVDNRKTQRENAAQLELVEGRKEKELEKRTFWALYLIEK